MQLPGTDIENQISKLLAQTLNATPAFAAWFWEEVRHTAGTLPAFNECHAEVSPPRRFTRGQTDFGLIAESCRSIILCENKVIHRLDQDQRERYKRERDGFHSDGWKAAIVLVAPERYLSCIGGAAKDFDACISYEKMNAVLGGQAWIVKAIRRAEQGYIARGIPAVTANFEGYAALINKAFPGLQLLTKAGNNPTQSRTAQFDSSFAIDKPTGVPYVRLLHQWQEGRAKILFAGWGKIRGKMAPVISADVAADGYELDPNKSDSLGFMKPTPIVNNHELYGANEDAFIQALTAVEELSEWYLAHLKTVEKWVRLASKHI